MARSDQLKWDQKYLDNPRLLESRDASLLVRKFATEAEGRKALDLACGTGRNTLYLAKEGFEVDALDISGVALQELSQHMEKVTDLAFIHTQLVDLDEYALPSSAYDLIVMTNFLDRTLLSRCGKALRKGGIAIIETYMDDPVNAKPDSNPDFLLAKRELPRYFRDDEYAVVFYDEYPNEPYELYRMQKQGIVVKRL